jgi:GDP-L-fucose synthase
MYPDNLAPDRYPMTEDLIESGPPPPANAGYATAKRALWHGARALHDQHEVGYTALVPTNLYGPGDHYGNTRSHFLTAAIDKIERAREAGEEKVEFFGTGQALRQCLFSQDLATLIALIVEKGPLNETLNVAPIHNLSIRSLAETVASIAGFTGHVVFTGEGPDGQLRKDVTPARLLSLVPEWADIETDLADGLSYTIKWYREHVAPS